MSKRIYMREFRMEGDHELRKQILVDAFQHYADALTGQLFPIPKEDLPLVIAALGTLRDYLAGTNPLAMPMAETLQRGMMGASFIVYRNIIEDIPPSET